MDAKFETHTPGFAAGLVEDLPYAVRTDVAVRDTGKERDLAAADLVAVTSQAYLADVPLDPTRPPSGATWQFRAAGAKEGHGTGRRGAALVGLEPLPRRRPTTRRPVVALVDSLVRPHDWFGDEDDDDPFWLDARTGPDAWEPPAGTASVLAGEPTLGLAGDFGLMDQDDPRWTHAGHGTFIAGLVRQIAPDARVLSLPVMFRTGIVDPEPVQSALDWILDRCCRAYPDHPELYVDVVNLSFGEYLRGPRKVPEDGPLLDTLRELGNLGVRVVASAGNRATDNPVIPAAWAPADSDAERTGLVSVGALDPDGHLAPYSNHGEWVRAEAPGSALVSTLPTFHHVDWPDEEFAAAGSKGEDPNLQARGFGVWSGTSFAAGWMTAAIAKHLLDAGVGEQLDDVSPATARRRAASALAAAVDDVTAWKARRGSR